MAKKKNIKKIKEEIIKTDEDIKESQMEIARVSFTFQFTRAEAEAYIHKPKGQIARNLRKYMCKIFEVAAKKMIDSKPEENINNCKLNVDQDLK